MRDGHDSDCSVNNRGVPELLGPCDCGYSAELREAVLRDADTLTVPLLIIDEGGSRIVSFDGPNPNLSNCVECATAKGAARLLKIIQPGMLTICTPEEWRLRQGRGVVVESNQ